MNLSNFIYIKKDALPESFCYNVIEKFEQDSRKNQGAVGGGINLDIKRSCDLNISDLDDWDSFDLVFYENLVKELENYRNFVPDLYRKTGASEELSGEDTGYQIQRTQPKDFYDWHHDYMGTRVLTFIWYLNDIENDGYTEFIDGTKIQPETGKFVIFPATWNYMHRGVSPKDKTKYLCTGWIHHVENNQNGDVNSQPHQQTT